MLNMLEYQIYFAVGFLRRSNFTKVVFVKGFVENEYHEKSRISWVFDVSWENAMSSQLKCVKSANKLES